MHKRHMRREHEERHEATGHVFEPKHVHSHEYGLFSSGTPIKWKRPSQAGK